MKVQGFDYVPENLRSQVFLKAADAIIRAHEGMNNFYNEEAPTAALERLGTVIPAPAVAHCMTALLCVRLGNSYGVSWSAFPVADRLLRKQAPERWSYYFENVLPREPRILEKLTDNLPAKQWLSLVKQSIGDIAVKDRSVKALYEASVAQDMRKLAAGARKVLDTYYGKGGARTQG